MRLLTLLTLSATLLVQPAIARQTNPPDPQDDVIEQGYYKNVDGQEIHRPAHSKSGQIPNGATAKCRDGSFSFSQHHSGTCSGHHGVSSWLR
jgi:hypothetical protein